MGLDFLEKLKTADSGYFYLENNQLKYIIDEGEITQTKMWATDSIRGFWKMKYGDMTKLCVCLIEAVILGGDRKQIDKVRRKTGASDNFMKELIHYLNMRLIQTNFYPVNPDKTLYMVFLNNFISQKESSVGIGDSIFNALINFHYRISAQCAMHMDILTVKQSGLLALCRMEREFNYRILAKDHKP